MFIFVIVISIFTLFYSWNAVYSVEVWGSCIYYYWWWCCSWSSCCCCGSSPMISISNDFIFSEFIILEGIIISDLKLRLIIFKSLHLSSALNRVFRFLGLLSYSNFCSLNYMEDVNLGTAIGSYDNSFKLNVTIRPFLEQANKNYPCIFKKTTEHSLP